MKKFILGALAIAAAASFTSCDKTACEASKTSTDSLSYAYGKYVGVMVDNDFTSMGKGDKESKQEFLMGMQAIFGASDSENTRMGMQTALQMLNEMANLKEQGVELDRTVVLNCFKRAFLIDSLNMDQIQNTSMEFRRIYENAMSEAQKKKDQERMSAPDAIQNGKIGEQAVADLKAQNPSAVTTESGLTYVIEAEGEGEKPDENATVLVNYVGRHLNGDVFDSSEAGPVRFPLAGVVPGFREGLMQLAKGGKATLYIPGALAYGVNGQPAAGIGPNEMLVFDVELIDINPND